MANGMVIKVSTEQMESAASTVEAKLNEMRNAFSDLEQTMKNTTSYWQGDGAEHYRSVQQKSKDGIDQALRRMTEEVTDLRKMAGIYKEAESKVTTQAASLPNDVIS